MKKKRLFFFLLPSYLILIGVAILAISIYAFHSMSTLYFQALEADIHTRAKLLASQMDPSQLSQETTDALCKKIGRSSQTRFTVILPDGKVIADSSDEPATMEYHGDRPEIRNALASGSGKDRRYSRTLGQEMMYVAVALKDDHNHTICAVRASLPMTPIENKLQEMTVRIIIAALLTGLLAMAVCVVVVRRISDPLRGMSLAATEFAEGNFQRRIPPQQTLELQQLAESLNSMSEQLNNTLSTISEQRNEQNAVLSSMSDGVLAIDRKERIIHMNRVAGEILGIQEKNVKKELMQEAIRFANLQEFIKAVLSLQKPLSRDLTLMSDTEKQVQVVGNVLRSATGESIGVLIVLRDVTHLRHLETIRADFIANVSHELKTPITSIKGFVETLLSDDWKHEPDILRFLQIISQQAGRLNAIIDDLLMLSRLEQNEEHIIKNQTTPADVIDNAIALCELKAKDKHIRILNECPPDLHVMANAHLLEQAFANLIMNSVKYSDPEKTVRIQAEDQALETLFYVKDEGFGIEPRHLDRLFERFYRVDTARSRKLGGTGLGLSIVKHIIQVHGGYVRVDSRPGAGSTFILSLPKEAE